MKTATLLCLLGLFGLRTTAQLCPGGGLSFLTAVPFDPAWIYGCNTGTSCNGGVAFDNRLTCQPTTLLDACAPAPSCGTSGRDASNVWFSFLPTSTTATISCFQNTSLVIGIQAFSGINFCGTLTEIGCALSGGPSSGVQLNLSGLHPGTLYYFRIFGSAMSISQRTGLYCFCGTTGLTNVLLATGMSDFKALATGNAVELNWSTPLADSKQSFEPERSADGLTFTSLGSVPETGATGQPQAYHYTDMSPAEGVNYYRIKHLLEDGHIEYSAVMPVKMNLRGDFVFVFNAARHELQITVPEPASAIVYDAAGRAVQSIHLQAGSNNISVDGLSNGIYFLCPWGKGITHKFYLSR